MPRTAFAELFTSTVGTPPIQCFANWRAIEAKRLLKTLRFSVLTIAEMLGHSSEPASVASSSAWKAWGQEKPAVNRKMRHSA